MASNTISLRVPDSLIVRHSDNCDVLPAYRTEFMRDRDRLMYATAFRRLAGKTQIYTVGSDDHRKNRLTHTLEVAQIARTIAAALDFDSNLAEAIALGHDFGHTPFGHAGERMLHDIMIPDSNYIKNSPFYHKSKKEVRRQFEREAHSSTYLDYAFGFKHNIQSVRVAASLEDSYQGKDGINIGLNLTNFVLYGMMIHSKLDYGNGTILPNYYTQFDGRMKINGSTEYAWSFEAEIVRLSDDIAQWHHDLEDAMRDGVLPMSKICKTIAASLDEAMDKKDKEKLDDFTGRTHMDRRSIAELSHIVVNTLVNDLVEESNRKITNIKDELTAKNIHDTNLIYTDYGNLGLSIVRDQIIGFSKKIKTNVFKNIIKASIHHSRNVERMNEKGKYIIRKLFEAYYSHPQQLPDGPILHLLVETQAGNYKNIGEARDAGIGEARVAFNKLMENPTIDVKCRLMRRICDHIASMTDHYAIDEYNNLYG